MELILASTSPYRQALLNQAGILFRAVPPHVDEGLVVSEHRAGGATPLEICQALATAKAQVVAGTHPEALVVGSDQLLSIDAEILGKPGSAAGATAQLRRLAGRTHELITAISLIGPRVALVDKVVSQMTLRELTDAEITRYVAVDQPYDCAGSYKWESRGIALFERIETPDHTAIIGLPMIALISALRSCGFEIP